MAKFGVRVAFADAAVDSISASPTGQAYQFMQDGGEVVARIAKFNAPSRTGELKDSIESHVTRANATSTHVRITAHAAHAKYVHDGTAPIAGSMTLYGGVLTGTRDERAAYGKRDWTHTIGARKMLVAGQASQPFLSNAFTVWAGAHGLRAGATRVQFF